MFPLEPSADTRQNAHAIREMYVALVEVGFDPQQAIILTGQMVSAAVLANSQQHPEGQ